VDKLLFVYFRSKLLNQKSQQANQSIKRFGLQPSSQ